DAGAARRRRAATCEALRACRRRSRRRALPRRARGRPQRTGGGICARGARAPATARRARRSRRGVRALPHCAAGRAPGRAWARGGLRARRDPRHPHLPQARSCLPCVAPRLRPGGRDPRHGRHAYRGARGRGTRGVADPLRHKESRGRVKRAGATLVVTGLCTAYILWKIDLGATGHVLAQASVGWWLLALAIMTASVWPMAWRWQRLLAARDVHERLARLVRTYFVGYAAGQVLPTSLGGDASRIYETVRRHPEAGRAAAGTVLLERALGGVAPLGRAAAGPP